MKENTKLNILYLEKDKFIYSILLPILLYIFIYTIFNGIPNVISSIISIIYLIGACTIVLLSQAVLNICGKSSYRALSIFFIFIVILSILKIVPVELINYRWMKILSNNALIETITVEIIVLYIINMDNYIFNKEHIDNDYLFILLYVVSFLINYIALRVGRTEPLIFLNVLLLLMLIKETVRFRNVKFKVGNKINAILGFIYMLISIIIINILQLEFFNNNIFISNINWAITSVSYILLIVLVINKRINKPYRMLFSDLYKKNLEMKLLNKKVEKKNIKMEISQSAIIRREKVFKAFFVSMPIPLVILGKNGRVIFANASFQKLVEENKLKNIINKKFFDIINFNNIEKIDDLINEKKKSITGSIKSKLGEKYVDVELINVSENEVLLILNDITAKFNIGKLRTEVDNNKFQEKIKSDFLSSISQDLKTPIDRIRSASQFLDVYIHSNNKEDIRRYSSICKENCILLTILTENLIYSSRNYSDYLSPNLQTSNIVEIVEEAVNSLIELAKNKNIDLIFDTNEEEIYMNIDKEFMQRIIINLVLIAIKFTDKEGNIKVTIYNKDKEVIISVKDNGMGMEKEFIEKAFSNYPMDKNNNKNSSKASMTGLFVVNKLVEKLNGKINIESEINKGTNAEMKFYKEN